MTEAAAVPHVCHVPRCGREVPPEKLMCLLHWRKVPRALQARVNASYRPGQCGDRRPSSEWIAAARAAIRAALLP